MTQARIVFSAGRCEYIHVSFTATSMLLRPAEKTILACVINSNLHTRNQPIINDALIVLSGFAIG